MDFDVSFYVEHKDAPNDPESRMEAADVRKAGFNDISNVSVGKVITFAMSAATEELAQEQINSMAEKLLINPVYQKFSVVLNEIIEPKATMLPFPK